MQFFASKTNSLVDSVSAEKFISFPKRQDLKDTLQNLVCSAAARTALMHSSGHTLIEEI